MSVITGHTAAHLRCDAIAGFLGTTRQGQASLPHPPVTLEPGRWRAQVGRARCVRVGEGAAKVLGGSRGWRDRDQARLPEPRRTMIAHGHDGDPRVRGLRKPREPRDLVGDPPAAAIRFPDGVHRCGLPSAVKLQRSPPSTPLRDGSTISRVVRGRGNSSNARHRCRSASQQLRLALKIAGSRANNAPHQLPICPKCRPPHQQEPIFNVFHRGGLRFGHQPS